jgi:2-succinyl-5-enolpyruvyl-6-hydroxy-3-cyclohexene-1-carboxylate synthase
MTNVERAHEVIAEVRAAGVRDFCVCAGSRNSPFLAALSTIRDVHLYSFVDERSAAFFALGRAKRDGLPVAVVTTSGTAVAELLPAAVEAHYSGVPLVLITADRPARFRGTGAPQAIEQVGIFGVYASASVKHINVEFDEPLL